MSTRTYSHAPVSRRSNLLGLRAVTHSFSQKLVTVGEESTNQANTLVDATPAQVTNGLAVAINPEEIGSQFKCLAETFDYFRVESIALTFQTADKDADKDIVVVYSPDGSVVVPAATDTDVYEQLLQYDNPKELNTSFEQPVEIMREHFDQEEIYNCDFSQAFNWPTKQGFVLVGSPTVSSWTSGVPIVFGYLIAHMTVSFYEPVPEGQFAMFRVTGPRKLLLCALYKQILTLPDFEDAKDDVERRVKLDQFWAAAKKDTFRDAVRICNPQTEQDMVEANDFSHFLHSLPLATPISSLLAKPIEVIKQKARVVAGGIKSAVMGEVKRAVNAAVNDARGALALGTAGASEVAIHAGGVARDFYRGAERASRPKARAKKKRPQRKKAGRRSR